MWYPGWPRTVSMSSANADFVKVLIDVESDENTYQGVYNLPADAERYPLCEYN